MVDNCPFNNRVCTSECKAFEKDEKGKFKCRRLEALDGIWNELFEIKYAIGNIGA